MQQELSDSIDAFADALGSRPEYTDYNAAQDAFQQDEAAKELLGQLRSLSQELGQKQHQNELTEEDIEQYKALQAEFNGAEAVVHLQQQENKLTELLRSCNHEISQELDLDFAANAAPSGCGCS